MILWQSKKGEAYSWECIGLQISAHCSLLVLVLSLLVFVCNSLINSFPPSLINSFPPMKQVPGLFCLLLLFCLNPWEAENTDTWESGGSSLFSVAGSSNAVSAHRVSWVLSKGVAANTGAYLERSCKAPGLEILLWLVLLNCGDDTDFYIW